MTTFVFPLKGVHCTGCKGNLQYLLNEEIKPSFFKFKKIDVSANFQKLIVEIDDDKTSEEEVRRYITQTLTGSDYELVVESARYYWILGGLGLGLGALILMLAMTQGLGFWPVKWATAAVSSGLTLLLGAESFRKAKIELQQKKPAMDCLFLLSTGAATIISLLALVIPGLPMMFEASLLIFGFRNIGIAIKKSLYTTPNLPVRYQRLKTIHHSGSHEDAMVLRPGEQIAIQAGERIPIDGWLLAKHDVPLSQTYAMDVSRIKGTYLPEHLYANDAVLDGMVAQNDCVMQVGLGHSLLYFLNKPPGIGTCPKGQIWIYPDTSNICVIARSDQNDKLVEFRLTDSDFQGRSGQSYFSEILNALRLNTVMTHLPPPVRQQLARALVQHADKYGLTQTASSIARLDKELEDAGCRTTPIQDQTDRMLQYFVPVVIGVALVSGLVAAYFFSPLIAVRCVISILVSACPCTLGFVTPLVMDFAREKGKQAGVIFSQADAIETLADCDTVLLDIHGTATKGQTEANIIVHDVSRQHEIKQCLARLEQHTDQHVGKAIYARLEGDNLLKDTWVLKPQDIERCAGGIHATIQGKHYVLGNRNLLQQFGAEKLADSTANTTYLLEKVGTTYQKIATITVQDPLRPDSVLAVQQLKQRGLNVYILTGTDQQSAEEYACSLPGVDGVYAGYAEGKSKIEVVKKLQNAGHRVLMIGDGANDASAMKEAHASIAMKHVLSDEGAQYLAKARILNGNMCSVIDALDIAHQALWRIKVNQFCSLVYNLAVVLLTNVIVLTTGIVLHPGICAALMLLQIGLIILSSYQFKRQPLPSRSLLSQSSLFRSVRPIDNARFPDIRPITAPNKSGLAPHF